MTPSLMGIKLWNVFSEISRVIVVHLICCSAGIFLPFWLLHVGVITANHHSANLHLFFCYCYQPSLLCPWQHPRILSDVFLISSFPRPSSPEHYIHCPSSANIQPISHPPLSLCKGFISKLLSLRLPLICSFLTLSVWVTPNINLSIVSYLFGV